MNEAEKIMRMMLPAFAKLQRKGAEDFLDALNNCLGPVKGNFLFILTGDGVELWNPPLVAAGVETGKKTANQVVKGGSDQVAMVCVDKERLRKVLIHCIGDTRECPHCRKAFVPEDMAQKDAWKFYNDTFGMPAANKFERRAFEKIDEETLAEISRPLLPGKVQAVKPPLGVMPQRIWKEKRIAELARAITEYEAAPGAPFAGTSTVPWATELLQLVSELDANRKAKEVQP